MIKKIICLLLSFVLLVISTGCHQDVKKEIEEPNDAVCRITLFASNGSYDKRFLMMNFGHSFVSFENLSDSVFKIGNYNLKKGEEITISIWPITTHRGVWYNIESAMISETDKYSDRISISFLIDQSTVNEINSFIDTEPNWTPLYNCSDFTLDIYNIVANDNHTPFVTTPNTLVKLFKEYNFETCKEIYKNSNIGYYREGVFEKCDLNY